MKYLTFYTSMLLSIAPFAKTHMSILEIEKLITTFTLFLSVATLVIMITSQISEENRIGTIYSVFSISTCLGYYFLLRAPILGYTLSPIIAKLIQFGSLYIFATMPITISKFNNTSKLLKKLFSYSKYILFSSIVLLLPQNINEIKFTYINGIPSIKMFSNPNFAFFTIFCILYQIIFTIISIYSFFKDYFISKNDFFILYFINVIPSLSIFIENILSEKYQLGTLPLFPIGISFSNVIILYFSISKKNSGISFFSSAKNYTLIDTPAFFIDRHYKLRDINDAAKELFPNIKKNILQKKVFKFFPKSLMDALIKLLCESSENRNKKYILASFTENEFVNINDRFYLPKMRILKSKKNILGYILILEDVSAAYKYKSNLENEVNEKSSRIKDNLEKIKSLRNQMSLGFSFLAERHDKSTLGHLPRTAFYAESLAKELYRTEKFTDQINLIFIEHMKQVAPLHDIGKTYIDETLFNKPTRLTKEEFEEIKLHTIKGAEFIEQTLKDCTGTLYFQMAYNVAKYHHEWWNGTGYPLGLKGEEIPLCARIMAVADVYDALITKRPYKDAISFKDAAEMIKSQSGSHFDPEIVKAFENIQDKIFSYLSQEK